MSGKDKIREKIKGSSVIEYINAGNKKWLIGGLAAVVVIALAVTIWLNVGKEKYEVLFPGASKEENAEMYTVLQARDIKTQGASIAALNSLNQMVGKLLMHIRTDDRKVAQHVRQS